MCGRLNMTADPLSQLLMALVGMTYPGADDFNLAPTETVMVLRRNSDDAPELIPMRWWLTPAWAKSLSTKYSMFNAKSETAATSPAFRGPFQKRRCVVPISGFYEWSRQHNQKLPYLLKAHEQPGLLLAGLWDSWQDPEQGKQVLSFTILTTAASAGLAFVHHRQPVMLSMEEAHLWMDMSQPTDGLAHLLDTRIPVPMEVVPVSTHVNNARHKDARCVEPIGVTRHVNQAI